MLYNECYQPQGVPSMHNRFRPKSRTGKTFAMFVNIKNLQITKFLQSPTSCSINHQKPKAYHCKRSIGPNPERGKHSPCSPIIQKPKSHKIRRVQCHSKGPKTKNKLKNFFFLSKLHFPHAFSPKLQSQKSPTVVQRIKPH